MYIFFDTSVDHIHTRDIALLILSLLHQTRESRLAFHDACTFCFGLALFEKALTMIRTTATSVARTASRSLTARRQLSSVPKQHKAKDYWNDLKAKRPIDEDDQHVRTHGRTTEVTMIPNSLTSFLTPFLHTARLSPSLQQGDHCDPDGYRHWARSRHYVLWIRPSTGAKGLG